MSTMNGVVLKSLVYNGQAVKKWNHDGVQVFSAGSTVTYICNGESHTEEVDSGASVLSPTTFTPTLSGATFLGWSLSADSTTVQTSLTMGSEPIVLYAVFKYNTVSVSMAPFSQGGDGANGTAVGASTVTNIASVDFAKYRELSFSFSASLGQNFLGNTAYITVSCGGASVNIISAYRGSTDDVLYESDNKASGSKTLAFTKTSGTGTCTTTTTGDGNIGGGNASFSGAKLLGRTVVG